MTIGEIMRELRNELGLDEGHPNSIVLVSALNQIKAQNELVQRLDHSQMENAKLNATIDAFVQLANLARTVL